MRASAFEFRFRFLIHGLIYLLGFVVPWNRWLSLDTVRAWQYLASIPSRAGWISFSTATVAVLVVAIVLALVAALLRTWAAAYIGASVVQDPAMHGARMVAAGPFRYMRNPLYMGVMLHTLAISILMPTSGAVFTIVLIALFDLRLILAEESFLSERLGEAYRVYCARVPRLIPSLTPRVPASDAHASWGWAALGEIYIWGAVVSLAALGWGYNSMLVIQGLLVSLGVSMIARVFVPRAQTVEVSG